jgi:hypothetical protein
MKRYKADTSAWPSDMQIAIERERADRNFETVRHHLLTATASVTVTALVLFGFKVGCGV